jgi:hypothetical protein
MFYAGLGALFGGMLVGAFAPNGPLVYGGFATAVVGLAVAAMGANVGEHLAGTKEDPKP